METEGQWIGRPWTARAIRGVVLVVPFAASVAFAWTLSGVLPTVSSWQMAILRWLLIAIASTSVMVAFDRLTRRLLPLAVLFGLTLAFPDQAPSRFKIAMRIGTTLQLRQVVADARAGRVGETPAEAAEKLLELVGALSVHDRLTRGHSERVRAYTHIIGDELKITGAELDHLRWSALLHDIGKLLVSAEILNKPGRLTDAEYELVKQHPEFGRELVSPLIGWLGDSARAVWEHHEQWDGQGYPRGLAATEISLAGRVVAVADAYDVMTSARSYKDPISPVAARAELARCAGTHFDAAVVRAFLNVSLGRLRMAMGPLSWLTQLSFIPQALVTAGASGATALTAVVGLGAGALGVGLSDDGMFSGSRTVHAASGPTIPIDDSVGEPNSVGGNGAGPDDDENGTGGDGGAPGTVVPIDDGVRTTTTSSVPSRGRATPPPSTVPSDAPVTPGPDTTTTILSTNPGSTVAPTTPGQMGPTSAPPTTAPTGSATTAPATTAPHATSPTTTTTTTTTSTTSTTTNTTTTTTSTTTIAQPAAMQDLTLYLKSPGAGGGPSPAALLLTDQPPSSPSVFRITLEDGAGVPDGQQRFRWDAGSWVRFTGTAGVTLYLSGPSLLGLGGELVVDVELRHCTGDDCATLATRRATSPGPLLGLGYASVSVNFGVIDAVLTAGDSLELVVVAPAATTRDVWLAHDSTGTPSRFVFDQA